MFDVIVFDFLKAYTFFGQFICKKMIIAVWCQKYISYLCYPS